MKKKIMAMVLGMVVCAGQAEADICETLNLDITCSPNLTLL